MHKNEAIAQVAEQAMTQIFDIAQYAISQIADGSVSDIQPMAQTNFAEVIERAEQAQKTTRKPRTPKSDKVEAAPTTVEIEPANDFVDSETEEDFQANPPIEGNTAVVEPEDNSDFPDHPDAWFAEDLERAKNECRALLAKMMAKAGPNETRKNLTDTTGKSRATDFDADDCMKFYRAFRNNV